MSIVDIAIAIELTKVWNGNESVCRKEKGWEKVCLIRVKLVLVVILFDLISTMTL
jgi:ABC-type phosphate/phosphonate transport system permease subunit